MNVSAQWLAHLAGPSVADVRTATLVLLLLLAAAIDVRTMRIPNWLTLTGAVIGLSLSAVETLHPARQLLLAAGGMGAGLVLLLPLYLLRVMGAGDVKLMAMVGAFIGLQQIVAAVLCVFLAGGVITLAWAVWRGTLRRVTSSTADLAVSLAAGVLSGAPTVPRTTGSLGRLPYGVSIAAGTLAWLVALQFAFA